MQYHPQDPQERISDIESDVLRLKYDVAQLQDADTSAETTDTDRYDKWHDGDWHDGDSSFSYGESASPSNRPEQWSSPPLSRLSTESDRASLEKANLTFRNKCEIDPCVKAYKSNGIFNAQNFAHTCEREVEKGKDGDWIPENAYTAKLDEHEFGSIDALLEKYYAAPDADKTITCRIPVVTYGATECQIWTESNAVCALTNT